MINVSTIQPSLLNRFRFRAISMTLFLFVMSTFIVSSIFLDATLAMLPLFTQRLIGVITWVIPASLGMLLGLFSLIHDENKLLAWLGIALNSSAALFFTIVFALAG